MVFALDWLAAIRAWEVERIVPFLPAGGAVLEIGAGTGLQARLLAARGFRVTAVDLPASDYAAHRQYPVLDYDGVRLPLPDAVVDAVYSSSVLEHVRDLPALLAESARVLRPGGAAVHVLPTAAWRFWTSVAGLLDLPAGLVAARGGGVAALAQAAAARLLPLPHGESGWAGAELLTFRIAHWRAVFAAAGWRVIVARPLSLFYTGWGVLGRRLPLAARRRLAAVLGSACAVFVLAPPSRPEGC